jgi:hypothetical protein
MRAFKGRGVSFKGWGAGPKKAIRNIFERGGSFTLAAAVEGFLPMG